jgi:hypothetical protein
VKTFVHVLLGALFGFLLSMAGATDYDRIAGMFRFRDLHLMGVMGSAIAVAALGFQVLKRFPGPALTGDPVELKPKPMRPRIFVAGLVFGLGWALTGS